MKSINLGNSGLKASAVALGCMRIAELDTSELEQLIDASLEAGIDFFDHADIYGGGRCEERFGEYLHTHPDVRDRILIQSKCGIRPGFFDFSLPHILHSVDQSLTLRRHRAGQRRGAAAPPPGYTDGAGRGR